MTTIPFAATVPASPQGPVLVLLPARPTSLHEDLLRVARAVAGEAEVIAVQAPAPDAAVDLAAHGVSRVLRPQAADAADAERLDAALAADAPGALADAAVAAAAQVHPRCVLTVANPTATDVAGQVSVRLGSGAVVDVAKVTPVEGGLRLTRQVLDATWTTVAELTDAAGFLTVQYGATVLTEDGTEIDGPATAGAATEESLSVTVSEATRRTEILTHEVAGAGDAPLTGAQRVVVAGRGVGEDLTLARDVARQIDAVLGATRVVTENGWAPHELQVGQSGVVISPRLYLGLGVSGQVHHTMGIQASQYIVAVCDDPDAPIFEMADFGVVGDLTEVVPQLLEDLRSQN